MDPETLVFYSIVVFLNLIFLYQPTHSSSLIKSYCHSSSLIKSYCILWIANQLPFSMDSKMDLPNYYFKTVLQFGVILKLQQRKSG